MQVRAQHQPRDGNDRDAGGDDRPTAYHLQAMSWANLGRRAKAFRIVHTAWSVVSLASLGYIWLCASTGRRDRRLWASVAFLSLEGAGLVVGRGNCPMGPLQAQWGDPAPLFELVLPPRAAKAAVPVLAGITVAGIAIVVVRRPSRGVRSAAAPG